MREIHDRMPVNLGKDILADRLDPGTGLTDLLAMFEPCPDASIEIYPVSSKVNSPKNNGLDCVAKSTPVSTSRS